MTSRCLYISENRDRCSTTPVICYVKLSSDVCKRRNVTTRGLQASSYYVREHGGFDTSSLGLSDTLGYARKDASSLPNSGYEASFLAYPRSRAKGYRTRRAPERRNVATSANDTAYVTWYSTSCRVELLKSHTGWRQYVRLIHRQIRYYFNAYAVRTTHYYILSRFGSLPPPPGCRAPCRVWPNRYSCYFENLASFQTN